MRNGREEVVVITGASAGLGRAIARAFARRGARLGLLARGEDRLEDARREARELGGDALSLPTDVADPEAVEAAASAVEAGLGPIDIWINNAMTSVFSPVIEMRPDEYRRVTEVTYLGVVYGTLAALRRMRPRNHGVVIQVGSGLAYRAIPLQSAYCGANRRLVEADFVLGIGSIVPHRVKGLSGGAKIAFPGVSGPEMMDRNQWEASMHMSETVMGEPENPMRLRMEEAANLAGLRFIVNAVTDVEHTIVGCFTGHPVAAAPRE